MLSISSASLTILVSASLGKQITLKPLVCNFNAKILTKFSLFAGNGLRSLISTVYDILPDHFWWLLSLFDHR